MGTITGTPKDRLAQLRDELEEMDAALKSAPYGADLRTLRERRARTARQIAMLEEGERNERRR